MSVVASRTCFLKNNKPFFLISGEIHYFRIQPRLWKKHLTRLKESGANTVSTYIPWDWHSPSEGVYDFSGETDPGRNLVRFIDLCKDSGLDMLVKPGPYILAEYELHGLPSWLLKRCSRASRAVDESGEVIADELFSYMSEEFLRETGLWYDQVMPLLAQHEHDRGGPITMMQVCNEAGVFQWLSGRTDYSTTVMTQYRRFLKERYEAIHALNKVYETDYESFDEILAPSGPINTRHEYCAYHDFHLFYRHYFALYIDVLIRKIRSYGITAQLTHNIPGWIYGNAAELPMMLSTYAEILRTRSDIAFGLDHIPEFVSYRNAHADLACNKILEALQPKAPVWAAEFQAGSREHFVKCDPNDMRMFYFASLAHGLKGFNYYMFSGGINPKGKGYFGKTFYFQTPLTPNAETSTLYQVTREVSAFIRREKENLSESRTRASVCVGFYAPYFFTELTSSQLLRERRLHVDKLGLVLDPRFVRETLLFNGLLRALPTLNIPYDVRDLEFSDLDELLKYRQLWVVSTELMDAGAQKLLAAFLKGGGHLIITPAVPTLDNYLNACTLLRDEAGLTCRMAPSPHKVDAFGIEDIFSPLGHKQVYEVPSKDAIARTKTGEVCGVQKTIGDGRLTALGFAVGYTTDEHLRLYEAILALDGIKPALRVSDPDIQFVIRRGKESSYLFLLNYHNARKTFRAGGRKYTLNPISFKVVKRKPAGG